MRSTISLDGVAESYVKLVLSLGRHDPDYVDAYYGPTAWQTEVDEQAWSLEDIGAEARLLLASLTDRGATKPETAPGPPDEQELLGLRHDYLARQLASVVSRVSLLGGGHLTFDEESEALYDAVAPTQAETQFERTLAELEARLPGDGSLIDRYESFRRDFEISNDRLDRVFTLAIAECRARTAREIDLPSDESFTVEYVTDKSWSGYNWYQGDYRSLIQVNTDLPIYIDRAIDLACHEGYPGHHVYNVLLERHLVRERGWPEFSVYALFSPQSLIAEGTANYGIDVAFPEGERLAFEERVLYPAAGLDASRAPEYEVVQGLVARLDYAGNEAARRYLDGEIDRATAAQWLSDYAMMTPDRARQRTRFFDQYRSYVINYNLGRDLVAAFVESRGAEPADRWEAFADLLASPRLPSGLAVDRERR